LAVIKALLSHFSFGLFTREELACLSDLEKLTEQDNVVKLVLDRVGMSVDVKALGRLLAVLNEVIYDLRLDLKLVF
jgi:hypothetical protein